MIVEYTERTGTATIEHNGVTVTITKSDGSDEAVLVWVETDFEPDGSDDGPGLRVELNDNDIYEGVPYTPDMELS